MRTPAALLLGAALGAIASPASAQQAPAATPPDAAAPAADPPREPPYDPATHGGLPYGTYLRATRGRGLASPGMMVVGILLVGAGNAFMGVGTGMYASAGSCTARSPEGADLGCSTSANHTSGMAVLIAGTVFLGIGIPLWVMGETPVPRVEAASVPSLAPTVRVGPLRAALSWSF
jgi:hypothetical protein